MRLLPRDHGPPRPWGWFSAILVARTGCNNPNAVPTVDSVSSATAKRAHVSDGEIGKQGQTGRTLGSFGDHRKPALAHVELAPSGALAIAWEDYSHSQGVTAGVPGVVVHYAALHPRNAEEGSVFTENWKGSDEYDTGLVCGSGSLWRTAFNVCQAAHCTNTIKDADEIAKNCGGADCAPCR
jgi:hypothetical protein